MDKENVHFQRQCQQKSLFSKTMSAKEFVFKDNGAKKEILLSGANGN